MADAAAVNERLREVVNCMRENAEEVKRLVEEEGADPNWRPLEDYATTTAWAAFMGHVASLRQLCNHGGDVSLCNSAGSTCLHNSCHGGRAAAACVVVAFGGDPTAKDVAGRDAVQLGVATRRIPEEKAEAWREAFQTAARPDVAAALRAGPLRHTALPGALAADIAAFNDGHARGDIDRVVKVVKALAAACEAGEYVASEPADPEAALGGAAAAAAAVEPSSAAGPASASAEASTGACTPPHALDVEPPRTDADRAQELEAEISRLSAELLQRRAGQDVEEERLRRRCEALEREVLAAEEANEGLEAMLRERERETRATSETDAGRVADLRHRVEMCEAELALTHAITAAAQAEADDATAQLEAIQAALAAAGLPPAT